jgi:hypothetical protein
MVSRAHRKHHGHTVVVGLAPGEPECTADLRVAAADSPREVQALPSSRRLDFDPPSDVGITAAATDAISTLTAHASTSVAVVEPQKPPRRRKSYRGSNL